MRVGAAASRAPHREVVRDRDGADLRERVQPDRAGRRGGRRRDPVPAARGIGTRPHHDRHRSHGDDVHQLRDAVRAARAGAPRDRVRRAGAARARPVGMARRGTVRLGDRRRRRPALRRPAAPVGRHDDRARPEPDAQGPAAHDRHAREARPRTERDPRNARLTLVARADHGVGELAPGLPGAASRADGGGREAAAGPGPAGVRRRHGARHDPDHARRPGLRRGRADRDPDARRRVGRRRRARHARVPAGLVLAPAPRGTVRLPGASAPVPAPSERRASRARSSRVPAGTPRAPGGRRRSRRPTPRARA